MHIEELIKQNIHGVSFFQKYSGKTSQLISPYILIVQPGHLISTESKKAPDHHKHQKDPTFIKMKSRNLVVRLLVL